MLGTRQSKEDVECQESEKVRDKGHYDEELGELSGGPSPLKVPPPIQDGDHGDAEREYVVLDEGCGEESPRIPY